MAEVSSIVTPASGSRQHSSRRVPSTCRLGPSLGIESDRSRRTRHPSGVTYRRSRPACELFCTNAAYLHLTSYKVVSQHDDVIDDLSAISNPLWDLKPWSEVLTKRAVMIHKRVPSRCDECDLLDKDIEIAYDAHRRSLRAFAIHFARDHVDAKHRSNTHVLESYLKQMVQTDKEKYIELMTSLRKSKAKASLRSLVRLILMSLGAMRSNQSRPSVLVLSEYVLVHCAILPWLGINLTNIRRLVTESIICTYTEDPRIITSWTVEQIEVTSTPSLLDWTVKFLKSIVQNIDENATRRIQKSFQLSIGLSVFEELFFKEGSKGIRKGFHALPGFTKSILQITHHPSLIPFTLQKDSFRSNENAAIYRQRAYRILCPEVMLTQVFPPYEIYQSVLFKQIVTQMLASPTPAEPLTHVITRVFASTFMITRMIPFNWPEIPCEGTFSSQAVSYPYCTCRKCVALKAKKLVLAPFSETHLEQEWNSLSSSDVGKSLTLLLFGLFRSVLWCEFGQENPSKSIGGSSDNIGWFQEDKDSRHRNEELDIYKGLQLWKRIAASRCPDLPNAPSCVYWGSSIMSILATTRSEYGGSCTFTRLPISLVKQHCTHTTCNACGKTNEGSQGMRLCGGCKLASYCDVTCHDNGWMQGHRRNCATLAKVFGPIQTVDRTKPLT